MIIGYRGIFPDYFDGHEVAAIGLKALPPGERLDDGRKPLRQFIPVEVEHPRFAGVRIEQR